MSRFPGRQAIFVDPTGRRRRIARRGAVVIAALAVGYLGLLVSTVLGGPSVHTPLIPVPKAARPESKPQPTVTPSEVANSPQPTATPMPSGSQTLTPSASPTPARTQPPVATVTPSPTPTTGKPTTPPGSPTTHGTTTGPGRTNSPTVKPTRKPGTA
ncbi:MAG TPA: hypothetical protein VGJ44_04085 [Kribbellaceae bacterium]